MFILRRAAQLFVSFFPVKVSSLLRMSYLRAARGTRHQVELASLTWGQLGGVKHAFTPNVIFLIIGIIIVTGWCRTRVASVRTRGAVVRQHGAFREQRRARFLLTLGSQRATVKV